MKKFKRILSLMIGVLLLCLLLAGCSSANKSETGATPTPGSVLQPPQSSQTPAAGATPTPAGTPSPSPSPTAAPLTILYEDGAVNSITVKAGAEFTLSVDTKGAQGQVTFSSDNEKVATCDADGNVKALAEGTASITATLGDAAGVCKVTVSKPAKPTVSICFLGAPVYDFTMNALSSETIQLKADISNAGETDVAVWSSSDPAIASVSADGLVTALSEGSAKIICTCGESKAECWVRVRGKRPAQIGAGETIDSTEAQVVITYSGYVSTDFTIATGESIDMNYKLYNTDTNQAATWSIADPSIASVDQNGTVTGLKKGSTELHVTCGALSATCIVRVSK